MAGTYLIFFVLIFSFTGGKMDKGFFEKDSKHTFCCNSDFELPEDIITAIKKEEIVIFAGAGISTEGRNVYKNSLYSNINDELGESNNNSFSKLMTMYCNLPNGRRKLINKIMERFDYYKSFTEIDKHMSSFFEPLSDIYGIKDIITTNWDRQFEEKCGCVPILYDSDISVLDEHKRKVFKIHGSIENIGTLIMTESDYSRCYRKLSTSVLGGKIKYLLSNKTIVFIGYSLSDEDFKKIWEFIDKSLGDLKPHFFIVSPDIKLKEIFKTKNVTIINAGGAEFVSKIRDRLIEDKHIFNSECFYSVAKYLLEMVIGIHDDTFKKVREEKEPLILYSILFQDGLMHSLQRIIARKNTGDYMSPSYLFSSIGTYSNLFEKEFKDNNYFDSSYILGYMNAMIYVLRLYNCLIYDKKINPEEISLYYLPKNNLFYTMEEFNDALLNFKTKKYIEYTEGIAKEVDISDTETCVHHIPFL